MRRPLVGWGGRAAKQSRQQVRPEGHDARHDEQAEPPGPADGGPVQALDETPYKRHGNAQPEGRVDRYEGHQDLGALLCHGRDNLTAL